MKADQFRGQHFRAEFAVSYLQKDLSNLEKDNSGTYQINRRRYKSSCANPVGVDLICLAMRAKGTVENMVNDHSRIKFDLLKDRLDYFDDLGLSGINKLIHPAS